MVKHRHRVKARTPRVPRIPTRNRKDGLREELDRVIAIVNERTAIIEKLARDSEIQFKRIAQIQADLDLIKRAWEKSRI